MNNEENNELIYMDRLEALLVSPESVSPDDVDKWLADKDFLAAYKSAIDIKRAMLGKAQKPDVKREFRQFRRWVMRDVQQEETKKPSKIVKFIPWIITAAAVALALVMVVLHFNSKEANAQGDILVYSADNEMNDVTLTIDDDTYDLSSSSAATATKQRGIAINKGKSLSYADDESAGNEVHSLATPNGKTFLLSMPDGTNVWMNAESHLKYPGSFRGKTRTVALEGEAYFDVAKDANRPFIIKTGKMTITVLGTAFNLRAYRNEAPSITLVRGKVSISANGQTLTLTPGHTATLNAKGHLVTTDADTEYAANWKDGVFYFDNVALKNIMTELGRWYRMDVVFKHPKHLNDMLHLNIDKNWDVEDVVNDINTISNTKIHIENNSLVIE